MSASENPGNVHPEGWYQERIMRAIRREYPAAFVWKAAAAAYSRGGIPDVLAVVQGRLFAFEVKRPGGRLTYLQAATLTRMNRAGAVALVVTWPADALRAIAETLGDGAGPKGGEENGNG